MLLSSSTTKPAILTSCVVVLCCKCQKASHQNIGRRSATSFSVSLIFPNSQNSQSHSVGRWERLKRSWQIRRFEMLWSFEGHLMSKRSSTEKFLCLDRWEPLRNTHYPDEFFVPNLSTYFIERSHNGHCPHHPKFPSNCFWSWRCSDQSLTSIYLVIIILTP